MREPTNGAKTNPLAEKPANASEWAVTFTPVDVPTRQVDEAVSHFVPGVPSPQDSLSSDADHTSFEGSADPVTCHSCGHLSDGVDLFCISCGEFLEVGEKSSAALEEEAEEAAAASALPLCGECGTEATEGEIFCLNCGAALP